jgi:SAM-dependent methyltransferase
MNPDIYYQSKYWNEFPKQNLNIVAKDLNPSWDESLQKYKDHTEIIETSLQILKSNTSMNKVLDFGCGMGRNLNYLKTISRYVFGFDTEIMISNLKKTSNNEYNFETFNFDDLNKYAPLDLIYECTVFQHMPPQEVLFRLMQMKHITKYIYLTTRCYNDMFRDFKNKTGGVNLLKLIDSLNCFEVVDINIDKNEAMSLMDETHYSMLLKVK